jgi:hypothetical protein
MNEYNGWTNYATWRVNLEVFDGYNLADFYPDGIENADAYEIGVELSNYVYDELILTGCDSEYLRGWLSSWLNEVNWTEIAEYLIENAKQG